MNISETNTYRYWDWTFVYPYLYLRFAYDNESDRYFPERGVRLTANYDYNFVNTHYLSGGIHAAIPAGRIFTILPALRGRYILGDVPLNEDMDNFVSGTMEGRYYEQQIPFIGFNGLHKSLELLTEVDLELRFKIGKRLYLSLIGASYHDGTIEELNGSTVYAAAIQAAYKTKFGPIKANVHWESENRRVGFYLGAGYDF